VSDVFDTSSLHLPHVYTRPILPVQSNAIPTMEDLQSWPHLRGINFPSAELKDVLLLIGQDTPEALVPRDVIVGAKGEPYATRSIFGWALNGPMKRGSRINTATSNFIMTESESLEEKVERFWKIDGHGLYDDEKAMSVNDKEVMTLWDKTTLHKDNHYVMAIPFKDKNHGLPESIHMAERRLSYLKKKLNNDNELKQQYTVGMQDMFDNGYAEIVPEDEIVRKDSKVWYLPHHPVINPNKDKLRIVFDCAAVSKGHSLNSAVYQGPDLTSKLIGVLLRFRLGKIALMADVKAMFHQVKVMDCDKDMLRFLWWKNGNITTQAKVCRMTVHLFGGTWSPSACAFALKKTVKDFGHEYGDETKYTILNSFYVDDCLIVKMF
jgi:hypothetical protein